MIYISALTPYLMLLLEWKYQFELIVYHWIHAMHSGLALLKPKNPIKNLLTPKNLIKTHFWFLLKNHWFLVFLNKKKTLVFNSFLTNRHETL